MKYQSIFCRIRLCKRRLLAAALFVVVSALVVQTAAASNAPLISGSYEIVQSTDLGSEAQVQIRIHLVNRGPSDLSVQKITVLGSFHPDKAGTVACAVTLPARGSADTTQEFTIPRSDYRVWQRGFRPRLMLRMAGPGKTKSSAVVRLDRSSSQEAK
jgi:hypothetical protein